MYFNLEWEGFKAIIIEKKQIHNSWEIVQASDFIDTFLLWWLQW